MAKDTLLHRESFPGKKMNFSQDSCVVRGVTAPGAVVIGTWLVWALLALSWQGCSRDSASASQIEAARKVALEFLDSWLHDRWQRMYELSTRQRIEHLTDLDPRKGSQFAKRAFDRFALVSEQAKRYMGYEHFEIEKTAVSKKHLVVFVVRAKSEDGRVSQFLLKLVRRNGAWRVD